MDLEEKEIVELFDKIRKKFLISREKTMQLFLKHKKDIQNYNSSEVKSALVEIFESMKPQIAFATCVNQFKETADHISSLVDHLTSEFKYEKNEKEENEN